MAVHFMPEKIRPAQQGLESLLSLPLIPGQELLLDPKDLTKVAPKGNGVYGYQKSENLPFLDAPPQEPIGGVIHFDSDGLAKNDFFALARILQIPDQMDFLPTRQYAPFIEESGNPMQDGYLKQMRLASRFALKSLFEAIDNNAFDHFPPQPFTMAGAMWAFIESEIQKYGTFFGNPELEGKFGGDGNFAREQLSFGIMVENSYFNIYRIWSRAWLVTK